MIWKTRRGIIDLTHCAQVMGILNVTPDSFSDGGAHFQNETALVHAREMITAGAIIIDVGGESTRPGALAVSRHEEISRTVPVIAALRQEWDGFISIDTSKADVAEAALKAGADIVNDVSGLLADPKMPQICAAFGCGVVVMHMQGNPRTMQTAPHYVNVISEILDFFAERMSSLTSAGIASSALCFDSGIGFGKTIDHNLTLLREIEKIKISDRPTLLGASRKSFIGKILSADTIGSREWPTVAITAMTREKGVMLHRVHSVRANLEALRMTEAILSAGGKLS